MSHRITQAKLQRYLRVLSGLIATVHDARVRYRDCSTMRPARLAGMARFAKELAALPHSADFARYEEQFKRRLVRIQARLEDRKRTDGTHRPGLATRLPAVYSPAVAAYQLQVRQLLRSLADVPLTDESKVLKSVKELSV